MNKKISIIGIIFNLLLFILVLYTKNISILLFLSAIYIIPALINAISFIMTKTMQNIFVLPLITTIFYIVFSYFFMRQPNFIAFVSDNSKSIGDLSIQINDNLLAIGPITFVFLLNIASIYLSKKISRREQYVER